MWFNGLRGLGSRISILIGGQVRTAKIQPFHVVKRYQQYLKTCKLFIFGVNLHQI